MKQLVINPGSTSTKIAVFEDEMILFEKTLRHSAEEMSRYNHIIDELDFRKKIIMETLEDNNFHLGQLSAVVGRGGLLRPIASGTYEINELMIKDLKECAMGQHASNLGGILAYEIAKECAISSFIVDPVVVDELEPIARLTGHPRFERKSIFHALNQKAVGRKAATELGKKYNDCNLIIAHLGGGITVSVHHEGQMIDIVSDDGGPFSPERAGRACRRGSCAGHAPHRAGPADAGSCVSPPRTGLARAVIPAKAGIQ